MSRLAPIVIFAYRRPEHLHHTLASLMRCDGFGQSPVIVYGDGPRNAEEGAAVMATREVAATMLGDRAEYHFSEENRGLSRSVIAGVGEVVERFGRAIVVEDDLELGSTFLTFMNRALDRYADDARVFQVSGYMFDVPELRATQSALFLPLTTSWGWATWKRAWDQFDPLATGWDALHADRALRRRFNLDGAYDYTTMLFRQMTGQRDSWAIRWYWTVFKAHGLVLFPPVSLVRNTGFDGSGTHGRGLLRRFAKPPTTRPSPGLDFPQVVNCDAELYARVKKVLWWQNGGLIASWVDRLRRLLRH
jgi:hypothetical protein